MHRAGAALVLLALFLSACSLGARQAQGQRIIHSAQLLEHAGTAAGFATWASGVGEIGLGAVGNIQTLQQQLAPVLLPFVADLGRDRAQFGPPNRPLALYDRSVVFVRRTGVSPGLTAREWSRFDFANHKKLPTPGVQALTQNLGAPSAGLLHPGHLLELVAGALTGSVKRLGTQTVLDVPTTHYKFNISLDNADRELKLDETHRDARRAALTALAIKGDLLPAEVWLDRAGVIRRLSIRLTQHPARRVTLFAVARLDITSVAEANPVATPTRHEYVRVDSPLELVRSLRSGTPA